MGELDKLLACDTDNVVNSRKAFQSFDPGLLAAFDTAAEMFITFGRCTEGKVSDAEEREALFQCCGDLGMTEEELINQLEQPDGATGESPALTRAREAYVSMRARRARAVIFLLLQRDFMWGATDLFRMRVSPAEGYRRLEAEAVGLLVLMRQDSRVGDQWLRIGAGGDGPAFFRQTQPKLKEVLRSLELHGAYDQGSAVSQHVRVASAVLGLSWTGVQARLNYQEFRAEDAFSCFLGTIVFLSTQVRVFRALTLAFPEVTDPIWGSRVHLFTNEVARLWKRLEARFPRECREMEEERGKA